MERETTAAIRLDNISAAFEQSVGPGLYSVDPVFAIEYSRGPGGWGACEVGLLPCKSVYGGNVAVESQLLGIDRKLSRYPSLPATPPQTNAPASNDSAGAFIQEPTHRFRGRLADKQEYYRPISQIIPCQPTSTFGTPVFDTEETRNAVKDRWAEQSARRLRGQ
jgi:hypothetical protein